MGLPCHSAECRQVSSEAGTSAGPRLLLLGPSPFPVSAAICLSRLLASLIYCRPHLRNSVKEVGRKPGEPSGRQFM